MKCYFSRKVSFFCFQRFLFPSFCRVEVVGYIQKKFFSPLMLEGSTKKCYLGMRKIIHFQSPKCERANSNRIISPIKLQRK